jgi:hypothetical protein
MKPSLKFCLEKMRLLQGQDFFPSDQAVLEYLAKCIRAAAESPAHVERMLVTWIGRTRAMLHPSDLDALSRETVNGGSAILPAGCQACVGADFVIVEREGATAAKRCDCPRGRRLAALDAARDTKRQGPELVSAVA